MCSALCHTHLECVDGHTRGNGHDDVIMGEGSLDVLQNGCYILWLDRHEQDIRILGHLGVSKHVCHMRATDGQAGRRPCTQLPLVQFRMHETPNC